MSWLKEKRNKVIEIYQSGNDYKDISNNKKGNPTKYNENHYIQVVHRGEPT